MNKVVEYKDCLGRDLRVGNVIIYVVRYGSSMSNKIGLITGLSTYDYYRKNIPKLIIKAFDFGWPKKFPINEGKTYNTELTNLKNITKINIEDIKDSIPFFYKECRDCAEVL